MKWKLPPKNKFRAKRTPYKGVLYDSKKEADYAQILDMLRTASNPSDRVVRVDRQVDFILSKPPNKIIYRLDFRVSYADGHTEHIEVKGFETPTWRMKHKMMKEKYPHINIMVIK
jgi:hypothetical protein